MELPHKGCRPRCNEIEAVINNVLTTHLEDFEYDGNEAKQRIKIISDAILKGVKALKIPRYKYVSITQSALLYAHLNFNDEY